MENDKENWVIFINFVLSHSKKTRKDIYNMISKWRTVSKKAGNDLRIFESNWYEREHPDTGKRGNFIVLDSSNWVNIIPVTREGNILLIEQYRHGTDDVTIEVPGGLVEPGEDSRKAAERECREETGYIGDGDAELLGVNEPNPAFMTNSCRSYLWRGCRRVGEQNLDQHEDISVIEVPIDEVKQMILGGKIKHSLVLTAFFFYSLKYNF